MLSSYLFFLLLTLLISVPEKKDKDNKDEAQTKNIEKKDTLETVKEETPKKDTENPDLTQAQDKKVDEISQKKVGDTNEKKKEEDSTGNISVKPSTEGSNNSGNTEPNPTKEEKGSISVKKCLGWALVCLCLIGILLSLALFILLNK